MKRSSFFSILGAGVASNMPETEKEEQVSQIVNAIDRLLEKNFGSVVWSEFRENMKIPPFGK